MANRETKEYSKVIARYIRKFYRVPSSISLFNREIFEVSHSNVLVEYGSSVIG